MSKPKDEHDQSRGTAGVTRREFLTYTAAGTLAGLSQLVTASGSGRPGDDGHPPGRRERHTLFFNFSHDAEAESSRYFLVAGGRRYRLRQVGNNPAVLRRERRKNRFLQQIPDAALTHFVEDAVFDANAVQLCYTIKNPDTTTGQWSMVSMFYQLPASAVREAYRRGVDRFGEGPRPLSVKRQLYDLHEPATTAQDLLEEQAVKDSSDHAVALVGVHPQLVSGEPVSAAHVQQNHIAQDANTLFLAQLLQQPQYGPATPQQTPNQPNAVGWATLTPIVDDSTGQPFVNQKGNNRGLIQYHPDWNADVANLAGQSMTDNINATRDDTTLGGDVTGVDPNNPTTHATGAIWQRHDGFTTIDQTPVGGQSVQDTLKYVLNTQNTFGGFNCTGSATAQADGSVLATLTFTNWFVRWLGIFILFLDANGKPLDASGLKIQTPPDYTPDDPASAVSLQVESALFALLLGPEFTLFGIPILNATATISFTLPEGVSSVRVFAAGPSFHILAPPDPKDPSTWGDPTAGLFCTALLNFGLPILLLAVGATASLTPIQKAALPFAASIAVDVVNLIGDAFRNQDFGSADAWKQIGQATMKAFLTALTGRRLAQLITLITVAMSEGAAEDAIPIAGQIALAISVTAGIATILETTLEIAASPISYVYDLVLTHDLSVTLLHDPKNGTFPTVADYYKVTALFDGGGTPIVQTLDMPAVTPSTLPPVVFKNVPLGGQVNVPVGFYSRSTTDPTQNDWLAAKGTTGLVDNTLNAAPVINIQEFKVPIQSTTTYEHKQKTTLDAQGNHIWLATPEGPTVKQSDIECGGVGNLCDFRGITVRQGTSNAPGYVGYAWQGYSAGVNDCGAGGQGQLDQLGNMGDTNPQSGYATARCGFTNTGVRLTYSLLTQGQSNFYLDTTSNVVRRVQLDPTPEFDDPSGNQAWGALNLDSTTLLLHPSGRLVSINNEHSKIETLKIPGAAMSDDQAKAHLLAEIHAGEGSRPGLINAPSAAAISADGVLLILETQNNRLQAFDLGGNPVKYFGKQQTPYFLALEATDNPDNTVYLDLAVEFTGYLYVLSYNLGTDLYRLDIYHPGQNGTVPISTTENVNAAKLTVDFWRNMYTLNYEVLQLPTTPPTVPAITEPSVSLWVPSVP